jgi:hypothetical protein
VMVKSLESDCNVMVKSLESGTTVMVKSLLRNSFEKARKSPHLRQIQCGSNITGTNCDLFTHNQSRSYLNHLVITCSTEKLRVYISCF